MKPRDLLLRRHRHVNARLDEIRQTVLDRRRQTDAPHGTAEPSWLGWFNPFRWHVVGLGAAWLLIALLNLDLRREPSSTLTTSSATPRSEAILAARENRQHLLQLLETPTHPSASMHAPRRRSSLQSTNATA